MTDNPEANPPIWGVLNPHPPTPAELAEEHRRAAREMAEARARFQRGVEQEDRINGIEQALSLELREEISEEIAARQPSAETLRSHRSAFEKFRKHCAECDLPCLPAAAQTVAGYLASECARGTAHLNRIKAAISHVHRLAELPDPTGDVLVASVVRYVRKHCENPAD